MLQLQYVHDGWSTHVSKMQKSRKLAIGMLRNVDWASRAHATWELQVIHGWQGISQDNKAFCSTTICENAADPCTADVCVLMRH